MSADRTQTWCVLIVDGHDDTRAMYSYHLQRAGCEVEEAGNGEDGLAQARGRPHDLIVMEVSLPGVDGYEMCRQLRLDATTLHTPLVVVTADTQPSAADRARAAGADAVLIKPCLPETLTAAVEHVLYNAAAAMRPALSQDCD